MIVKISPGENSRRGERKAFTLSILQMALPTTEHVSIRITFESHGPPVEVQYFLFAILHARCLMWVTVLVILATTIYRVLPHPYNVAPVGAMFLLGGLYLPRRSFMALTIPFAAVVISDVMLYYRWDGSLFHAGRLVDYGAFALITLIGRWASVRPLGARAVCVVATPVVFYLVSNFGVWLGSDYAGSGMYPRDLSGLISCYVAALPFFQGTLIGDGLFAGSAILLIEGLRRTRHHASRWHAIAG